MPYRRKQAVQCPVLDEFDIAKDLKTSGSVSILAPSGAGKTTFLRRLIYQSNPKRVMGFPGSRKSAADMKRYIPPCWLIESKSDDTWTPELQQRMQDAFDGQTRLTALRDQIHREYPHLKVSNQLCTITDDYGDDELAVKSPLMKKNRTKGRNNEMLDINVFQVFLILSLVLAFTCDV